MNTLQIEVENLLNEKVDMLNQLEKVEEKLLEFNTIITLNDKLSNENTFLKAENQSLVPTIVQYESEIEHLKGIITDQNSRIDKLTRVETENDTETLIQKNTEFG